jgi:hypothetical protein
MWYALFDFEHAKQIFLENPQLYTQGIENKLFGLQVFWSWIAYAFW